MGAEPHAPAALQSIEKGAEWISQPVWTLNRIISYLCRNTNHDPSIASP